MSTVRDHIPLEQGLRRGRSPPRPQAHAGQRPYSIRTRIKTVHDVTQFVHNDAVRDHIPLEQGLRQRQNDLQNVLRNVRDHIPLEQGLRRAAMTNRLAPAATSETIFH